MSAVPSARRAAAKVAAKLFNPEVPHRAREWAAVGLGLPATVAGLWALLEVVR